MTWRELNAELRTSGLGSHGLERVWTRTLEERSEKGERTCPLFEIRMLRLSQNEIIEVVIGTITSQTSRHYGQKRVS